jgi:hypothetical protein
MIKKTLKWLAIAIGLILLALLIAGIFMHESKPKGQPGAEADALANKMLTAINKPAWDSTKYVHWSFKDMHTFLWDKERDLVRVRWDEDNEVLLNTKTVSGNAYIKGIEVIGQKADDIVQSAWSYFCNDSFWLNAPAKAFDPGTSRSIVTNEDGTKGLLIRYDSGGVTPGDSYLWLLDESGLPQAYKMWVKIMPIGGVEASWEKWETISTGAKVATFHQLQGIGLDITDLKAGMTAESVGENDDPFKQLGVR